jgi:hypothetical protein
MRDFILAVRGCPPCFCFGLFMELNPPKAAGPVTMGIGRFAAPAIFISGIIVVLQNGGVANLSGK